MPVQRLSTVTPIYMVGDSHCIAYGNTLFRAPWSQQTFFCRSRFLPQISASTYCDSHGHVHPALTDALKVEGVLDSERRPAHLAADPHGVLSGLPVIAPPLVFFAGESEVANFYVTLRDRFDFELPGDTLYGCDKKKQPVPFQLVHDSLSKLFVPLLAAARQLKAAGCERLMIHALPPRTRDETQAAEFTNHVTIHRSVRAKATVAANRILADACAALKIGFIDITPETTGPDGYVRPEFELDGMHLHRDATLISLEKIAAYLFDETRAIANPTRYKAYLQERNLTHTQVGDANAASFTRYGIALGALPSSSVDALARGLSFEIAVNSLARTDWSGWPRSGRMLGSIPTKTAVPSEACLRAAYEILSSAHAREILHAGGNTELTVVSFRPLRIEAEASTMLVSLPTPPGGRRSLFVLRCDNPLTFTDGAGLEVETGAGTLAVYDPARIACRIAAGTCELFELCLVPRLAEQPFRVVWAGLCDWPADPFRYSVDGMLAIPPFEGAMFSALATLNHREEISEVLAISSPGQ